MAGTRCASPSAGRSGGRRLSRARRALARRRNALGSNSVTFDLGELVEEDPAEAHDDPESFRSLDLDLDPEESEKPLQVEV